MIQYFNRDLITKKDTRITFIRKTKTMLIFSGENKEGDFKEYRYNSDTKRNVSNHSHELIARHIK